MSSNNIAYSCITASPFFLYHQFATPNALSSSLVDVVSAADAAMVVVVAAAAVVTNSSSFVVHLPTSTTSSLSLVCVPYVVMFFLSSKSFINSCPFVPCIVLPPPPSNTCHHYSTIMIATTASTYTYLISNSINNRIGTEGGWDIYNTGIRLDFGHGVGDCVKYWQA
jgi:hypothetical protein